MFMFSSKHLSFGPNSESRYESFSLKIPKLYPLAVRFRDGWFRDTIYDDTVHANS